MSHVLGFMVCMLAVLVLGAVVLDQTNPLVGLIFVCWGAWVVCDTFGKPEP